MNRTLSKVRKFSTKLLNQVIRLGSNRHQFFPMSLSCALFFPFSSAKRVVGNLSILCTDVLAEIFCFCGNPAPLRLVCKGFDVLSRHPRVMAAWKRQCYENLDMVLKKRFEEWPDKLMQDSEAILNQARKNNGLDETQLIFLLSCTRIPESFLFSVLLSTSKFRVAFSVFRKFYPCDPHFLLASSASLKRMHSDEQSEVLDGLEMAMFLAGGFNHVADRMADFFFPIALKLLNCKWPLVRAKALMLYHKFWQLDESIVDRSVVRVALMDSDSRVVSAAMTCCLDFESLQSDQAIQFGIVSGKITIYVFVNTYRKKSSRSVC